MKTIGVIPARYASTRFPAKVLAAINGVPMIEHVWRRCKQCRQLDEILIACDEEVVLNMAKGFGATAVMTALHHPSGSDRIAQAVKDLDVEIVVNVQGDEPFIDPATIDALVAAIKADASCQMATVVKEITDEQDFTNPNVVKCVLDKDGYTLYFSRAPIPYNRNPVKPVGMKLYKHVGLYAYRKAFLLKFTSWPKSSLENMEQLEQLRALEQGVRIKTIVTTAESVAVDTPQDLQRAEEFMRRHG